MTNPIWEQNLSCLPDRLRQVLPAHDQPSPSIQIIQGEKGWPVARIKTSNGSIHTNSLVDPLEEASQWADTLDYQDVMVSFIYGCGFGYPLLEYAKRKKFYTQTFIFEHNVDLFHAMLRTIDMRPLLLDSAYHFVVGDQQQMNAVVQHDTSPEFLLRATKPASFFTWLAHRNEKETYLSIHESIWTSLELSLTGVGNAVHDNLIGLYNMIDNVESVMGSPQLSSLQSTFQGKPAFIVSNGPSLDKNIELLSQAKGKALILTAESALKPCLKRSIQPDAVSVLERTPSSYHVHFKDANLSSELVLVGLNLIDPRIQREFPGPWVPVFRRYETTSQWINEAISDGCGLHGGGSSAHLAFEFALWVGANPIIFVGQDLAFGPDQSTHSKLSSYSEEYMAQHVQILQSQPVFMVKGIDGKPIPTIKIWYEFKTWFEQQISRNEQVRFIDCTEGGAYIEGTELMPLKQAIQLFCRELLPITLYEQVKRFIPESENRSQKYQALLEKICEIRNRLKELAALASQDIQNCKLIERACALQKKNNQPLPPKIYNMFDTNMEAFRKFGVDPGIVTFTQSIIFASYKEINDLGEINSDEKILKVTNILRKMFEDLKDICSLIAHHFDLAESRTQQHMKRGG